MITHDGYPVPIDLDNDSPPTGHVAPDGRLRRLRRYAEIGAYSQSGLLGLPEVERCLPRQQMGTALQEAGRIAHHGVHQANRQESDRIRSNPAHRPWVSP